MKEETIETKSIWDSNAEKVAFEILKEKINTENYQISKHISLKEIFKNEKKEPWMDYHIDFLIEDIKGYPVLGIEVNGIKHWNSSECKERDKIKRSLFVNSGIPLICIPLPELPSYTKEEYKTEYSKELQNLMEQYLFPVHHRTFYPVYCRKCGHQFAYRFRKDYLGSFYYCKNNKCTFESISAEKIPLIFKEKLESGL